MIESFRRIGAVAALSLTAVALASCADNAGVVDGEGPAANDPATTPAPTTFTTQPASTTTTAGEWAFAV